MKLEFTVKTGSGKLILIAAGWGTSTAAYAHIAMPGWDVAVLWGIDDSAPDWSRLQRYHTIYLYAWSLGVSMAERSLPPSLRLTAAYAVNGTVTPYDDERGIPRDIFDGTCQRLDERNLRKFRMRMFDDISQFRIAEQSLLTPTGIDGLRDELRRVILRGSPAYPIVWTKTFVGMRDRIFPPCNQLRAWDGVTEIIRMEEPHYIDLQRIVSMTVVNVDRVGQRFTRSLETYDAHAHAQRVIAGRLADEFMADVPSCLDRIVEIGPGTGLLTGEWARCHKAAHALYVDLGKMPHYCAAQTEEYRCCDAEVLMEELAAEAPESVDAIVSSSAIQWLSDLDYFFGCCSRALKPGGHLAMSTFAPGNLNELRALRPDHLRYLPAEKIEELLRRYFREVRVVEDTVELDFTTPLEALRHLRLTGVTASGYKTGIGELRQFAARYPQNSRKRYSLTFRPIYMSARK
ncbi:MAG: DUF452 family protein [Muribaculaceae bacterium]|nr:DUF452 family protein [Muribaculaceae bacterium]